MPKLNDPKVNAMRTIAIVLAPLNEPERDRVARWVFDRYLTAPPPPLQPEAGTKR